jgi:hypothetical protein
MKTSLKLLFALTFMSNFGFAQQKTFVLINKKNQDSIFINENHRIKLFTNEGKKIVGRLKIIDDNTILVKSDTIAINTIIQIKKASVFSTIAGPVFAVHGATFIVGGLIGLAAGGWGILIAVISIPIGTPMFVIPLSDNEHRMKKWDYKIIQTNK